MGNKQIASELGLAEASVKGYVSALFEKFEVPNRAALAEAGAQFDFTGAFGVDRAWIRQMFRDAAPSIAILRGPTFEYEAVNAAFGRSVGGRVVVGREMREAIPELAGQDYFDAIERVYRSGEPWVAHEVPRSWNRGNGIEHRLVDLVIQPLRAEDGEINGVMTFSLDVTDVVHQRKRAELLNTELAALLDLVPSGVVIVDAAGYVVKANATAQRIAGRPLDSARTMDDQARELFKGRAADGHPLEVVDMPFARALRGIATEAAEFSFLIDESQEVWIRSSIRPLRHASGAIDGAIAVFTQFDPSPRRTAAGG